MMKLLVKTSRYYFLFSIPVLVAAGFICYQLITSEVKESNNELLLKRKSEIAKILQGNDSLSVNMIIQSGEAIIYPVAKNVKLDDFFSDTLIYDDNEKELATNKMLSGIINTSHGKYLIHVWRSTLEYDELLEGIITSLAMILVFLLVIFFLINFWISKTIWNPFYKTLEQLQNFSAISGVVPDSQRSKVKEFQDLNASVYSMMNKMVLDFKSQKKFIENASHELQTPLAVINSKLDLLIQSDKLSGKEMDLIHSIEDATTKLSRINKALLLLTKIENGQFIIEQNVSMNKVIDESLILFEDYIHLKKIKLIKKMDEEVNIRINTDLALILVNNLIQNSIRYNTENGIIVITLNKNFMIVANTGVTQSLNNSRIFQRFQKSNASSESLGLGLSIALEIAEASNLQLQYKYESGKHSFTLEF